MEDLERVIENASQQGAEYCDVRYVTNRKEEIEVRNANPERVVSQVRKGYGVRVLCLGAWGFAAGQDPEFAVHMALKLARASALTKKKDVKLAATKSYEDSWESPIKKDPFSIPIEEKVSLLVDCSRAMAMEEHIRVSYAGIGSHEQEKWFFSSNGARIHQKIVYCGGVITAISVKGGEAQQRSYPTSLDGNFSQQGYEFIESLNLLDHCQEVATDSLQLLEACSSPVGRKDIVLDSSQVAVQVHESCGHPAELDRVMGHETSFAGTSFLDPEKLGTFVYGSPHVTVVADSTIPKGLGTFGYDDEGVRARESSLIDKGVFSGYLTSRETAEQLGEISNGAMRAMDFNCIPLIRMTNVSLMPGDYTSEELLEEVKEGVYMETLKSWSIDDKRVNFQFGCEIGYEIRHGELTHIVKNPSYTGLTPEFWKSCDAVSKEWQLWGIPNCGKGDPPQSMYVGNGAAPARFRNIQVGR